MRKGWTFALALALQAASGGEPSGAVAVRVIVVESAAEAQQLLDRLARGEDFAALAREKSLDPTAGEGGYLGRVDPATLRPALREALAALRPGGVSGVVPLSGTYAIVKLLAPDEVPVGQGMGVDRDLALAARGSIRYPPDVAGQVIAAYAFQKRPKPAGREQDLAGICEARKRSLAELEARLRQRLQEEGGAATRPADRIQMRYALAQIHAYRGEMGEAVAQWEAALRVASDDASAGLAQLEAVLGTAYFHKAEMENAAYRAPGDRCLFPPRSPISYAVTGDSEKAIRHLSRYLEQKPEELQVKWLLNLAYMTLGKYPEGVPPRFLIPPAAFASGEDVGRFADRAAAAGLDLFTSANGLVVDDVDNDGLLDVLTSSYDVCAPMRLLRNEGDGTFADRSERAGLAGQLGGLNMIQADYDNDGCLDVLVLRGAWEFPQRKSLLRGDCRGGFRDVTREAALAEPATQTQAAAWADLDNDGHLDLFVGNENGPAQLFRNRGDGTFKDVARTAGVDRVAFTKGVAAGDYDGDGFVDLYVSNLHRGSFLYRNNGDGTFREVSEHAGVRAPQSNGFATWFFDYDNDGRPDLFAASYSFSVEESLRSLLGLPAAVGTPRLHRNRGDGTFKDVTAEVGLDRVFLPMGANFGDLDNDGFLDVYLATGGPEYGAEMPNVLLRNREGRSFVDVTASSGTGDLHKGHGTAFADLDQDGDAEIVTGVGGATPGDAHALRVFENPGHGNRWLEVKLVGVKTNRSALGARIKVTVDGPHGERRVIHRTVGSGGSFGASPLAQHIGLGRAARIRELEVAWPRSRTTQRFSSLALDQAIEVRELAGDYRRRPRRPQRLGGGAAARAPAVKRHPAAGLVVEVDARAGTLVVSCAPIPGYREEAALLALPSGAVHGLEPGAMVDFTLVVEGAGAYAEDVHRRRFESAAQDPLAVRRLELVEDAAGGGDVEPLAVGQPVPDFSLTDQQGRRVTLSQFTGQVVAVSFTYTRCPLADYCFRLSNNFGALQRRFRERLGRDVVLLTISFDPVHDQVDVLADYARTWKADPDGWRFLTGAPRR